MSGALPNIPFEELPLDTISDVVRFKYEGHPDIVAWDDPLGDENPRHGVNTEEDKHPCR